jgi:energy-coupling factor transporter ATP-binding protein EcfA2
MTRETPRDPSRDGHGVGVEVTGLTYHYPDGSPALRGVDFAAAPGERVALLGPNGAGKSTLLLHLAGLLPERRHYLHRHGVGDHPHRHPGAGSIRVDGVELTPRTIRHVRDRVGIVFEDPDDQLFGLTVGEDVAFGPQARGWGADEVARAVDRALAAVRLTGLESRAPHHLSAGEKRRACLAGALACGPGLLLLDEPSSGLDPRGRRELAELLLALPATMVVASHDLDFLQRLCTRAVILDRGEVVRAGPLAELLADRELLARHGLA